MKKYPSTILENAKSLGFKTANLSFLPAIATELNEKKTGVKYNVPEFYGLSHDIILNHLNQNAPEWHEHWNNFISAFKAQKNKRSVMNETAAHLLQCQTVIKQCFINSALDAKLLDGFLSELDATEKVMVRSTGREDSTEQANPGANESYVSETDQRTISQTIGDVVSSYFSVKSLSQRLKSTTPGEEINEISAEPFMPVLVQKLVGDAENKRVFSGVIYSDGDCSHIQIAPGHGELVVNSLANFDSHYVTQENRVYSEIMRKNYRVVPMYQEQSRKITLELVKNKKSLRDQPSISEEVVRALHTLSKQIEKKYGMRMDIEFAYNAITNTIEIVQARAIPLGSRRGLAPSSFSRGKIKAIKADARTQHGKIITPDILRAQCINSSDEMIVCNTIEEALDIYLASNEASTNIKAVIIEQDAASTSHPAGEFNSKGISVLKVDDISKVRTQIETLDSKNIMVIAPQDKLVTIVKIPKKTNNPEQYLYQEKILEEGLFRSAMSPHVLANLIESTYQGKSDAQEQLFKYLYQNLIVPAQKTKTAFDFNQFKQQLDNIADVKLGDNTTSAQQDLAQVTAVITSLKRKSMINTALYQKLMLCAGELLLIMQNNNTDDASHLKYLNLFEKFNGLIMAPGRKAIFSSSVIKALIEISVQRRIFIIKDRKTKLSYSA